MSGPALVAPDSFKGSFSAAEVATAIARGLRRGGLDALELPVADGGEGTMEVLADALGAELRRETVSDPLGRPLEAPFALLADGSTAIVETARASGLGLVPEEERDAVAASTRGTGELIAAAARAGAQRVIVSVGGSATTDGAKGALEALDEAGVSPRLEVLCDVRTAWEDPMTGAARGLAGGLWAQRDAKLVPGAAFVLDALGFDRLMRASRFVVTGEGSLDRQTLQGKVAGEVATRCRQSGVTCHAVVGRNALEPFEVRILDLETVSEAPTAAALEAAGRTLAEL